MQAKLVKIGLILFLVIGISGCGEMPFSGVGLRIMKDSRSGYLEVVEVCKDSPSLKAGIQINDRILAVNKVGTNNLSLDKASTLMKGSIGTKVDLTIQSPATNISRTVTIVRNRVDCNSLDKSNQQRQQLGTEQYNLQIQIEKTKTQIVGLKQDRDQKVLPLKQKYSTMYEEYYPKLSHQLPEIEVHTHEELLKNCEQYLELCSSLNRVAKLQYYISKLDDKLKQIGVNIIKLDDNIWDMERTLELAQIFSKEELESVERLIEETKGKIDSQVPPPERQDIAGLEEKIFNNILRS